MINYIKLYNKINNNNEIQKEASLEDVHYCKSTLHVIS